MKNYPTPPHGAEAHFDQKITNWVHRVVDGGRGPKREVGLVVFDQQTGLPTDIALQDGTRIDLDAGTVTEGRDIARYHRALDAAMGVSPALRADAARNPVSAIALQLTAGKPVSKAEVQRVHSLHAPRPRPIGADLGRGL